MFTLLGGLIAIVCVLLVAIIGFKIFEDAARRPDEIDDRFAEAIASTSSEIGRILLRAARPMSAIPALYEAGTTPQYRDLRKKLFAARAFGESVEVFLAVQALCILFATCLLVFVIFGPKNTTMDVFVVLVAGLVGVWPWQSVSSKAKKRAEQVAVALPEFAELLLMPLESGMTPLTALSFTADRLDGPVAEEVRNMRRLIDTGVMNDPEAFQFAGERLGTPEAVSFFNALMHAHLEGGKLVDSLASQATMLREAAFQRARTRIRKLPIKIIPVFVVFLMPLLFVLALLPAAYSMMHLV